MKNRTNQANTPTTRAATGLAPVRLLRTPYHELGSIAETTPEGAPRVPAWAGHRSVYRAAGRTLYLVETDRLADAAHDLDELSRRGWQV
ncbi:hypothetical protein ACFPZL_03640, partial [Leucobacter soli]